MFAFDTNTGPWDSRSTLEEELPLELWRSWFKCTEHVVWRLQQGTSLLLWRNLYFHLINVGWSSLVLFLSILSDQLLSLIDKCGFFTVGGKVKFWHLFFLYIEAVVLKILFQVIIRTKWKVQLLRRRWFEHFHHGPAFFPAREREEVHPHCSQDLLPRVRPPHGGVLWSAASEQQRRNMQPCWAAATGFCCLHHLEPRQSEKFKWAHCTFFRTTLVFSYIFFFFNYVFVFL